MADSKRKRQLNTLIQKSLAEILLHYADEPKLAGATVLEVDVSPDLAVTKVFVSILDYRNTDAVMQLLNDHAKPLRHLLARRLNLRKTPSLFFLYDDTIVRGQQISSLINAALAADEERHQHTETSNADEA